MDNYKIIHILTAKKGYIYKKNNLSTLYTLGNNQRMLGTTPFFYQATSSTKQDFGLGLALCDSQNNYHVILYKDGKEDQKIPLDKIFGQVSCEQQEKIQLFIQSEDYEGERFQMVVVWNNPTQEQGKVHHFFIEYNYFQKKWIVKKQKKTSSSLSDLIDFSLIRVIGDFGKAKRIYYFPNEDTQFDVPMRHIND